MKMPSSEQTAGRRLRNTTTVTRTVSDASSPKRARLITPNCSPASSLTKGPLKQSAGETSASFATVSFYGLKKNKTVKENVPLAAERTDLDSDKSSNTPGYLTKFNANTGSSTFSGQRSHVDKLMLEKIALSPVKQALLQSCTLAEFRKVYRHEYRELEEKVKIANVRMTRRASQIINQNTEESSSEDSTDKEDTRELEVKSKTRRKLPTKETVSNCDSQPFNGNHLISQRRNQRIITKNKSNVASKETYSSSDSADGLKSDRCNSHNLNKRGTLTTQDGHTKKMNKRTDPKISTLTRQAHPKISTMNKQADLLISTPTSNERKFFKTRSPLEDTKKGVAVLAKGFNLKFMSKKRKTSDCNIYYSQQKKQPTSGKPNKKQKASSIHFEPPASGFSFAPGFLSPEKAIPERPAADGLPEEKDEEEEEEHLSLNRSICSTYSSVSQNATSSEVGDSHSVNVPSDICFSETTSHRAGQQQADPQAGLQQTDLQTEQQTDLQTEQQQTDLQTEQQTDPSVKKNTSTEQVFIQNTSLTRKECQKSTPSHKLFPIFERSNVQPASSNKKGSSTSQPSNVSPVFTSSKLLKEGNNSQMIIDAGQKKFGATQCQVCSMVYCHADPVDEAAHVKFHKQHLEVLKFIGWKKERVVQEYPEDLGRVILVMSDDPKYVKKKVDEVYQLMGKELGFSDTSTPIHPYHKVFLYVEDKQITGCCVAEPVQEGYRIIPGDLDKSQESGQRPWCCSTVAEPVCVGISRLWVSAEKRKSGVATKLVDCVRQWFNYGSLIPKLKIAFSDPTPDGRRFAQKYTGTPTFLVYKYNYG